MKTTSSATPSLVLSTIISHRLDAIVGDMAAVLANTAHSARISARQQCGCALVDSKLNVVACSNPQYLAALEFTARTCIDTYRFDLSDDDIILTNDPYSGTPSIHYFTVVAPVKLRPDLSAYIAVQAHMGDIGGWVMGNYDPTALELRTEGVRISPIKIQKFGRRRRDVIETIFLNSRMPSTLEGDLSGMLAALHLGQREFTSLAAKYGVDRLNAGMQGALDYSEQRARAAFAQIPNGRYQGAAMLSVDDYNWAIRVELCRSQDGTTLDFSTTDPQAPIFVNSALSTTAMQALVPLLGLLDEDVPCNSGILRALSFHSQDGTLVAPRYPAPTGWSINHVGAEVTESVRQALASVLPDQTGPGLPRKDLVFVVRREKRVGTVEEQLEVNDLAVLAQPGSNAAYGVDGWGQYGPDSLGQLPSVEEFEQETDLTIRQMEFIRNSAGAGRWRGCPGITTEIEFGDNCREHLYAVTTSSAGKLIGTAGGQPGASGAISFSTAVPPEMLTGIVVNRPVPDRTVLQIQSAGGGGFGDPALRTPEAVRDDILNGHISPDAARSIYGVDVDDDS